MYTLFILPRRGVDSILSSRQIDSSCNRKEKSCKKFTSNKIYSQQRQGGPSVGGPTLAVTLSLYLVIGVHFTVLYTTVNRSPPWSVLEEQNSKQLTPDTALPTFLSADSLAHTSDGIVFWPVCCGFIFSCKVGEIFHLGISHKHFTGRIWSFSLAEVGYIKCGNKIGQGRSVPRCR